MQTVIVYDNLLFLFSIALVNVSNISMVQSDNHKLMFHWNPSTHTCPGIHYTISSSNCGKCPQKMNHSTVTCTLSSKVSGSNYYNSNKCVFILTAMLNQTLIGQWNKTFNIEGIKGNDNRT